MRVARARWWWTTLPKRHARMMTTTRIMNGSMVSWRISLNLCSSVKRHARDLSTDRFLYWRRHRLASESMDDARQGESGIGMNIGTSTHEKGRLLQSCISIFHNWMTYTEWCLN
jgi:hypothetical protein